MPRFSLKTAAFALALAAAASPAVAQNTPCTITSVSYDVKGSTITAHWAEVGRVVSAGALAVRVNEAPGRTNGENYVLELKAPGFREIRRLKADARTTFNLCGQEVTVSVIWISGGPKPAITVSVF